MRKYDESSKKEIERLKNEFAKSNLQVKRIPFSESKEWHWNENGFLFQFIKNLTNGYA